MELQNEAEMSSKTPHDAHAWASDSETPLSKAKRLKTTQNPVSVRLKYQYVLLSACVSVMLACMCACKVEIPLCMAVCAPKNLL